MARLTENRKRVISNLVDQAWYDAVHNQDKRTKMFGGHKYFRLLAQSDEMIARDWLDDLHGMGYKARALLQHEEDGKYYVIYVRFN